MSTSDSTEKPPQRGPRLNLPGLRENAELASRNKRGLMSVAAWVMEALLDRLEASEAVIALCCENPREEDAERIGELEAKLEAAEATIARVEALPERWRTLWGDADPEASMLEASLKGEP